MNEYEIKGLQRLLELLKAFVAQLARAYDC